MNKKKHTHTHTIAIHRSNAIRWPQSIVCIAAFSAIAFRKRPKDAFLKLKKADVCVHHDVVSLSGFPLHITFLNSHIGISNKHYNHRHSRMGVQKVELTCETNISPIQMVIGQKLLNENYF